VLRFILSLLYILLLPLNAGESAKPPGSETIPLSKTSFQLINQKGSPIVDLKGRDFIVVSVREASSEGRFYAVDRDGTVWWSAPITSGAQVKYTPSGIFPLLQKKRYHMSSAYPDPNGINNMDYMMRFTWQGHALHQGSVGQMSHGCIHIAPKDIKAIFHWATPKTKIVITRHGYMLYAQEDLRRIYYDVTPQVR